MTDYSHQLIIATTLAYMVIYMLQLNQSSLLPLIFDIVMSDSKYGVAQI